jgi:LacI family transcriptional regulator
VAEDAGVSVAAVSKVLRDAYGVSAGLRERVQASIDRLGYRPSTAARAMRGQTYTVGLLMVEIANPFLPAMVAGINSVLGPAGYKTLIGVGEANMGIEQSLIDSMMDSRMDGLILIAPRISGEALAHYARQIPMVVLGHHEPVADSFDTVNSNDREGAAIATRTLIAAGHRDIRMLSLEARENGEIDVYCERERGYEDAMIAAGRGDRIHVHRLQELHYDNRSEIDRFLDTLPRPAAVFCWSDLHAIHLIDAAKARGWSVPGDLAVIGYDDSPTAAMSLIRLSSMNQFGERQGAIAAKMLLERIEGRRVPQHLQITPELIRRGSEG